jgi:Tetracyclin repressor-like, C-terminal domain/Bacterial regulatory proteins, tetR family
MTSAPLVAPVRRRGRPRSTEADEAILEAATDAFIELGWDGLTIEGVATRAGVGKTTIYRRYSCRLDLLLAAAYTKFVAERRASSTVPIERAMQRGELSLDVDISLMLDLLVAPVFYRAFVSRERVDDAFVTNLVDTVLRAFA